MFNLFRSQAKAMRYLLIVLLTLVAVSMVVTLIPGFGGGFTPSTDEVLAEVGDASITTRMVRRTVLAMMRQQGSLPPELADTIVRQHISRLVNEFATVHQARRMGFTVSDDELVHNIRLIVPELFQDGQFAGTRYYQDYLAQMNMTIPEFENSVRQQILLSKIQGIVLEGMLVTPKEIEAEFARRSETVKLDVVRFDPVAIQAELKATTEEMEAYLRANQARFQTPARRTVELILADEAILGKTIPVTEEALAQAYRTYQDRYRVEEKIHVRHILIRTEGAAGDAKTALKEKADALLRQLRGGADFADLAKKNSQDIVSAEKGGDLDWIARGQTVPEFENAAFSLKPKQISDVVESVFGFHIIQVLERQEPRVRPFEEVRGEVATELRRFQLYEKMPELADQARTELLKDPAQAREIARKLGLEHIRAENVAQGDSLPQLGFDANLDAAVSSLQKGGVSPVVQLGGNRLVVAAATEFAPPRPARLPEVESEVRNAVLSERAAQLAAERASQFQSRLQANGNNLRKTAQELGAKVITTNEFTRNGQVDGVGPAAYFGEQPFILPVGQTVQIHAINNTFFFTILNRTQGDPSKLEESRESIISALRDQKQRDRREMFEEGLVRQLTEEGEIKINEDAIRRFVSTFAG